MKLGPHPLPLQSGGANGLMSNEKVASGEKTLVFPLMAIGRSSGSKAPHAERGTGKLGGSLLTALLNN